MRAIFCLTVCLIGCVIAATPLAAREVAKVERGTSLRGEILDAARPVFERETGGPIEFVVKTLNVYDVWAFGALSPQRPGGGAIDWASTKFGEDLAAGAFEPGISFVLLRKADSGEWMLVEYAIGPTDVAWDWWRQQLNLPEALFVN